MRSIIPSFLDITETPYSDEGTYFGNYELKRGEVIKITYPTDKDSVTKKFIEYDILIENYTNGTANSEIITNVVSFNLLGSLSDRLAWTFRPSTKKPTDNKEMQGDGSKVLVMFINGQGFKPIILGGVRDINDESEKSDKSSDAGHHYEHVFNGLSTEIDKNGALTITFGGPTKNDGKRDTHTVKDEATGSTFKMLKNGNISISDVEDRNQILIDHEEDRILISSATGVIQMDADGIIITTPTGATIQLESSDTESSINLFDGAGGSLSLTKDGISAVDKAGSSVSLSGDGTVSVAGDSVLIAAAQIDLGGGSCSIGQNADSFMVRGTQLKTLLITLTTALTTFCNALSFEAGAGAALAAAIASIVVLINTTMLSQSNKVK